MARPGYIFGGTTGLTYDDLRRAREAHLSQLGVAPQINTVGEGINSAAQNVMAGLMARRYGKATAAKQERGNEAFNDYVNRQFGGGSVSTMGANVAGTPRRGDPAQSSAVRDGLIARGLPEHVADGFVMNIADESGFDTNINEHNPTVPGSRGGFGLIQWTGPRRVALEQYAAQRGTDPGDMDTQLDFLVTELQGPEATAARSIMSTQDAGSAAAAIATDFLRPAQEHLRRRVANYTGGQPIQVAQAGGMTPDMLRMMGNNDLTDQQRSVLGMLMQQQMQANDPMRRLQMENMQSQIDERRADAANGSTEYGLTPQYIVNQETGELRLGVLGKDGTLKVVDMPEGTAIQKGLEKLDLGTHYQWANNITGEMIGEPIPKNLAGAESERARGRAEGETAADAVSNLGPAVANGEQSIALIDSILNDEALPGITGMIQGRLPPMTPGGTDLNVKIEQLKGQAFLEAFETLKGGGQITEREGSAATAAMARLDRAQSTEAYTAALNELRSIMERGIVRARERAGAAPGEVNSRGLSITVRRFNPETGALE